MKIFGMGMPELLIILVVILLIFGPKNLPKLGNALGKAVKGIREGVGNRTNASEEDSAEQGVGEVVVEPASNIEASADDVDNASYVDAEETETRKVRRVVRKVPAQEVQ